MKLNLLNPHHNEPHEVGATRRAKTENFALLEARRSTCGSGAPFRRVVINGAGGAGKSTLARELSARWKLPRIEADALFWEPGWREAAPEVFRARVDAATSGESWIFDGNYYSLRSLVWPRAELLLVLDYRLGLVLRRVVARSLRRSWSGEACAGANKETWARTFSRESVILHTLRTHARKHREVPGLTARFAPGKVLVARSPRHLETLLREL